MNSDSDNRLYWPETGTRVPERPSGWSPSATFARGLLLVGSAIVALVLVLAGGPSTAQNEDDNEYNPRLFKEVASHLTSYYLDPDRIAPRNLIEKTFSTLENSVDEVYVENSDSEDPFVRVHVGSRAQVFNLNEISNSRDSLEKAVDMLGTVFSFLMRNYKGEMPLGDVQYAVLNGFLGGLDPHTVVFSPDAFREFFVHIEGEIYGVGMYVGNRNGKLQVIEVLKDTPADRANFKKGDIITKIGDESTINMTVQEAVEKIRGPLKSKITLTVKRPAPDEPGKLVTLPISVERNRVVIKSVESKLITGWDPERKARWSGGVGYVKVKNFDKNTTPSLQRHLLRLQRENGGKPLAGLILDMRGNSGGLLKQAEGMCDLFLTSGTIVSTATHARVERKMEAKDDGMEPVYPIVLLADASSASGAEIVVGALQKNDRAIVLGTSTFGKGSVQQLHRLSNEAQLKITVSEYLLPGDISIQENGVIPDILARPVGFQEYLPLTGEIPRVLAADSGAYVPIGKEEIHKGEFDLFPDERGMTEKDYERHIVSRFAKEEFPSYTLTYFYEPEAEDPDSDAFIRGDLQPEKDKLVKTALRLLQIAEKPFRPKDLLHTKKAEIAGLKEDLFQEIVDQLAKKGIDWSDSIDSSDSSVAKNPGLELTLSKHFVKEAAADEEDRIPVNKVVVTAKLTNKGDETVSRVKGITRSGYFLYRDREFLFGKIKPGQTVERSVRIQLPYFPHSRNDLLKVEVSTEDDKVLLTEPVEIELVGTGRPRFAYTAQLTTGDGDLITSLRPGMEALLKLKIKNTGSVPAHKGVTILRNETGRQVFLTKGRIEFDELQPKGETEIEFRFQVRDGKPVEKYDFELAVVDSYSGAMLSRSLTIPRRGAEVASPFPNGKDFSQPLITARIVDPANSDPVLVTNQPELQVNSLIRSAEGTPFHAWVVTTLLDAHDGSLPDKIVFADSKGKDQMKLVKRVPLKKGVNLVTVHVKDRNGLQSRKNLVVRRDEG